MTDLPSYSAWYSWTESTEFKNYYTGDPMDVYIILKRESRLNETRGIADCGNEIRFNGEEQDKS